MADFTVRDLRGSRTAGVGGATTNPRLVTTNLNTHMQQLRQAGYTLPYSDGSAMSETARVRESMDNRTLTASMGAARQRVAAMSRTGANVQLALPKVRKPMSSLIDKGIPFDTRNPKELIEIRRWARLFYCTHDLIPLLIDIYSKFPVIGFELTNKDPEIERFYNEMFFDTLDYGNFLQDMGREYFISGEINALGHFSETLGIWTAEEIMDPDHLHVSKPMFGNSDTDQPVERVQLMVKEMVEGLRSGSGSMDDANLSASERRQRQNDYQTLVNEYPEFIAAAAQDDGIDISDALISRIVNKVQPWDTRGTPHMMRSFKTLMLEESLNAAQDAVADRLYSPLILATLGIANLGDDAGPWIPTPAELDETRENLQSALAADFRLMVHHMGLDIKSVFGREAVPRFDTDYSRIDKKLMQAWGIGEALISGGTGTQNYASTALNREFVTQMMLSYQNAVKRHVRKRCLVIAEAQGHYDYDTRGGNREPVYREIVETDPRTGEETIRKVPKLLIPDIKFQSLNLRDEAQERSFLQMLKNAGVPISDRSLAVNVPIEFESELEKQSEEMVDKLVAQAQAMKKAAELIKAQGLPMPPELAKFLAAQSQLEREEKMAEQAGINNDKAKTDAEMAESTKDHFEETGEMPGTAGAAGAEGADSAGPNDMDNGIETSISDAKDANPPSGTEDTKTKPPSPRNRSRPAESDEQRKTMPKAASVDGEEPVPVVVNRLGQAPSSVGAVLRADDQSVREAIDRMAYKMPTVADLVSSEHFYSTLNQNGLDFHTDWPDIEEYHFASDEVRRRTAASIVSQHEDLEGMLEQYELVHGIQPLWV